MEFTESTQTTEYSSCDAQGNANEQRGEKVVGRTTKSFFCVEAVSFVVENMVEAPVEAVLCCHPELSFEP